MKAEVNNEELKHEEIKEELEMNEPQPGQLFTIDVLRVTKSAQNQYGLRHGNYQRYRNYCTRRLLRLRKSLNLTNGGKRYQKRVIKEEEVTSVRHLYVPLVQAERAWSYAMQLKDEARIDEIPPRVKFHIIRRFTKAVKWCNTLSALSKNKVDSKTALEIEAYECWMTGILLLEKEDWKNSLNASVKARTIYEQMVKMGDSDEQELFNERVNEIDISLRYCNFQLGGGSTEDIKSLISSNQGGGLDLLQAKLENALKDSRKKQSQSLEKITWRGRTVPIKSEKLRVSLLNGQEQAFELESKVDQEEKINLYSQLFSSYSESLEIIKNELRAIANSKEQKSSKVEQEESNLQYLSKYINFLKVSKTIERNELLATSLKSNLGFGKKGKKTKPDDLVRIFDSLIQNIAELELLSDKEDVENVKLLASRSLFYKSFRCFYLSLSFSYSNDWGKALVLLDRCAIRIQDAKDHFLECNKNYEGELQQLENLLKSVRSEKSVINSRAYLHSLNDSPVENDEKKEAPQETTISECLDEFVQVSTLSKLANFPPEFRPAPCKPVLFDLAQVEISFPDLEPRKQKKSFWRWW